MTKNEIDEMVIMNTSVYNKLFKKIREAVLVNESLEYYKNDTEYINGEDFFKMMREKYNI